VEVGQLFLYNINILGDLLIFPQFLFRHPNFFCQGADFRAQANLKIPDDDDDKD